MASKAISAVKNTLSKIKAPWKLPDYTGNIQRLLAKLTGVASSAEYLEATPTAETYREHSPGNTSIKAIIPHAETDRVYDIRYWIRDSRRAHMKVGGTNKKHLVTYQLDPHAQDEDLDPDTIMKELEATGEDFPSIKRHSIKSSLLDDENNGYT